MENSTRRNTEEIRQKKNRLVRKKQKEKREARNRAKRRINGIDRKRYRKRKN
jgi:hypothetical protein